MKKIKDFSNAGKLDQIHCWLIRLIAGKKVVILNTRFGIIDHDGRSCAAMAGVTGALIADVQFDLSSGKMVEIRQSKKSSEEKVKP